MAVDPTQTQLQPVTNPWAIAPFPGVNATATNNAVQPASTQTAARPADTTTAGVTQPTNPTPGALTGWTPNEATPLNIEGGHLKRGKSGEEVATLQRALSAAGFPVEANGRFGPETATAVKAFQAKMGLAVDGIAGPHTKSALEALRQGATAQTAMGANTPDAKTKAQSAFQAAANHLARIPADQGQTVREQTAKAATDLGLTAPTPDSSAVYPPADEGRTSRRRNTGRLNNGTNTNGANNEAQPASTDAAQNTTTDPTGNSKADRFIAAAKQFLGQPYKWGGGHGGTMSRPGPVDCSGLVQQAARMAGMNLDGTAALQQRKGQSVSLSNLKPGDLLFKGSPAHHVGIYLGNGQFMHAPRTGQNVKIQSMSSYRWTSARRVM